MTMGLNASLIAFLASLPCWQHSVAVPASHHQALPCQSQRDLAHGLQGDAIRGFQRDEGLRSQLGSKLVCLAIAFCSPLGSPLVTLRTTGDGEI